MVEEKKDGEPKSCCCASGKNACGTFFKVVLGLILLVLGGVAIIRWWPVLVLLIKGCIGPFLLLAGVITLAIAKE
ncbi:MAG TPA: hypothetical protein PKL77_02790 [Candidatus Omnitrophota bacterium]|nr:hypothetical protein [Candidatus Omnitrophota bacterium]HPT07086.1 hypothetical protein [Candidatus Omnitrophota bacterium]